MDPLDELLQGLRFSASFYRSFDVRAPWCLDIPVRQWTSFHFQSLGQSCLKLGEQRLTLRTGDLAILPHGPAHTFADSFDTPPPGPGEPSLEHQGSGASLKAEGPGERSVLLCGGARLAGPAARILLAQLPSAIVIRHRKGEGLYWLRPIVEAIDLEAHHRQPGSNTVIARLVDVLLMQSVRAWIAADPERSGWIRGMRDPQIGRSLALMHASPEKPWDLNSLSKAIGMCRASFAERFTLLIGKPPKAYLTQFRMNLAIELLKNEPLTVAQIAEQLGYGSEAAFSRAYKRTLGLAPRAHRKSL
ncbi:MAG: putative AraC family transcriptional regulator [Holophagaceae bacterium]|uniref:AraC family transcriptional regulator n=1 Tax=Holophaga foetida TaxID=35839 RepID=UPI0002472170|nr:AraC family transcriptional regulator [Holophaga foetida]MBP1627657.1 putative AraC family transcriptional regulator [Holophagaceae bacterium]